MITKKDISTKLKENMVNGNKLAMNVFREIKTEIVTFEKNNKCEVTDKQVLKIIEKLKGQHIESRDAFLLAKRLRQFSTEEMIISIFDSILPEDTTVSRDEVAKAIEEIVTEMNAPVQKKDIGAIKKKVEEKFEGRPVNGKDVADIVSFYIKVVYKSGDTVKDSSIPRFLEDNPEFTGEVTFDNKKKELHDVYMYADSSWGKQTVHFQKGKIYNPNGPSMIYENGAEVWTNKDGIKHREDGPAICNIPRARDRYFYNGEEVTKKDLEIVVERHKKINALLDW